MKLDIPIKDRNTRWKVIILILLVVVCMFTKVLLNLNFLEQQSADYVFALMVMLFFIIAWVKNYNKIGFVELGEYSIKVYKDGQLLHLLDYKTDKIDKIESITMVHKKTEFFHLGLVINGFCYLDNWNDTLEIQTSFNKYSFDIIIGEYKSELKGIDYIFSKLESKGIRVGHEDKKLLGKKSKR